MGKRRMLAGLAVTTMAAVTAIAFSVGPAKADTVIDAAFPVTGSTHLNGTNSDMALGPGTLSSAVDLSVTPVSVTGNVSLPPSTGSFNVIGIVPVSATIAFVPVGQTTGTITGALTDGTVTATSQFTLKITALSVAGLNVLPGDHCQTSTPVTLTVTSADFNALAGGTLTGTYTIPKFRSCGPLGIETPIINALVPGPNNTISLTLGTPTLSAG